jgi:hypothetical protein
MTYKIFGIEYTWKDNIQMDLNKRIHYEGRMYI